MSIFKENVVESMPIVENIIESVINHNITPNIMNKNYKCVKCDKIFNNKLSLTRHSNRKTECNKNKMNIELTEIIGEDRTFGGNELFIDLIPRSCWFTNVRTSIKPSSWNILRKHIYERVNYICECCGCDTKITKLKLEAHERWDYNIDTKTQKLIRFVALCKMCHLTTHYGNARRIGYGEQAKTHIMNLRNFNETEFNGHYGTSIEVWEERNKYNWNLDLELIKNNNIELTNKYSEMERQHISGSNIEKQNKNKIKNYKIITELNLSNKNLTVLPDDLSLYVNLQQLDCSKNQLTSLENLPPKLRVLFCYNNQLTSLDNLPPNLQYLSCSDNQLTSIKNIPTNLQELYCYNNQLSTLDNLPPNLQTLVCYGNQLITLPLTLDKEIHGFELSIKTIEQYMEKEWIKTIEQYMEKECCSLMK